VATAKKKMISLHIVCMLVGVWKQNIFKVMRETHYIEEYQDIFFKGGV
jgi:hypothetical protein